MTHEYFESESDIVNDMLLWLKVLDSSDWNKDEVVEAIEIKLKEYK